MTFEIYMTIFAGTFFGTLSFIVFGVAGWYSYQRIVKKRTRHNIIMSLGGW